MRVALDSPLQVVGSRLDEVITANPSALGKAVESDANPNAVVLVFKIDLHCAPVNHFVVVVTDTMRTRPGYPWSRLIEE